MWDLRTTDCFDHWFDALSDRDRANVLAAMLVLSQKGPMLARPYADTVYGSAFPNMKELRVQSGGKPIRVFFAFDPLRVGVLLCAGAKTGRAKRFYDELIPVADREYEQHLSKLAEDK